MFCLLAQIAWEVNVWGLGGSWSGGALRGLMAGLGIDPNKTMPDDISVLVLGRNAE